VQESAGLFERALRYVPDDAEALKGLAQALLAAGRGARAVELLRRASSLVERRGQVDEELALSLARTLVEVTADRPAAIAHLRAIGPASPWEPEARLLEGRLRIELGDLAGGGLALGRLRDAVERLDGLAPTRARELALLLRQGAELAIIVQKYGGSSVADVEKLGKVADRIVATSRAGNDVVVVVSAMGKATDGLLTLAKQVAASGESTDPPRRELDMLLSTGERVSMALLSIAIQARGIEAISFTGSQSGILTNDRHFDARIIEVRPHRIEDELARGRIVIVAGYQGMSYKREITTLGRGGSDTTAVALAAALEADACEIYSDVDGVYSADPRSVPTAKHIAELSHEVLQEMAECGAKVVCAQAVEWARRSGISIYARSTFDRARDGPTKARADPGVSGAASPRTPRAPRCWRPRAPPVARPRAARSRRQAPPRARRCVGLRLAR
jgi:uridylate kinase